MNRAAGDSQITTGSGALVIGIDGAAVVKNSNGDTRIGEVTGDLRVKAANGRISVDQADAAVTVKTANGDVRLGEVARGAVVAEPQPARSRSVSATASRPGWTSTRGSATCRTIWWLPTSRTGEDPVDVRARTSWGDIIVRRSFANAAKRGGMTTTMVRPALKATGLHKSFGEKTALDGIDLNVAEGSIFALLGPNGAGKTTTVQILSTLIGADGGDASIAGHDVAREPDAVRDMIGVTGQFSAVDSLLTGEENLRLMADLRHLERSEGQRRTIELLERFDLVEEARSRL